MRFDPVECGKRIKALREDKNLTQVQLAERISITADHLRAIERGRRACSIDLLVDISMFFEVSLDYLILGGTSQFAAMKSELCQAIKILECIKGNL